MAWRTVNTGGGCEALAFDLDDKGFDEEGGKYLLASGTDGELPEFPCDVRVGFYDDWLETQEIAFEGHVESASDLDTVAADIERDIKTAHLTRRKDGDR